MRFCTNVNQLMKGKVNSVKMTFTKSSKGKLAGVISLLLAFAIIAASLGLGTASASAADTSASAAVNQNTKWTYSDSGTDPAGDASAAGYDRLSWTRSGYDTTGWKTAQGSFGAKKGTSKELGNNFTANTLLTQYKADGSTDIEAYFFRTEVNVEDPSAVAEITGSVIYDDAAAVYINGKKIAGFDDESISANIQYGGSNAGDPKTGNISVTEGIQNILTKGTNVIAVEIHQGRAASSDIYFNMPSLTFSTESKTAATEIKSVSISVGSNETQRNFTWYCSKSEAGTLLITEADKVKDGVMPENSTRITASVKAASNKSGWYSNKAAASDLKSSTTYAYQLVNGDTSTAVRTFTVGSDSSFSFAFAGDPQIGASGNAVNDTDGWEKTLSLINSSKELKDVDFMLSAGDQVNTADNEDQYDGYLEHSTLLDLPVATLIGNHDSSSAAYSEHFNITNESTYGTTAAGGDYYFVYDNVLFMALNSNNRSTADHQAFMKEAIAATADQNIKWKIVTFHHSIYSVASHAEDQDILERRDQLAPVFKNLDIDVVLMGHDHVYCRTYMMDGLTPMTDASIYDDENYSSITNPEGILYVTANSASGSKFYNIKSNLEFPYSRVMNQERTPNISRVDVSDSKFTITTYRTSDMSVVDTFTINHKSDSDITPDKGTQDNTAADTAKASAGDKSASTGDNSNMFIALGVILVSGACAAAVVICRRKHSVR